MPHNRGMGTDVSLPQADLMNQVGTALLAKSLKNIQEQGADLQTLMASGSPQVIQDAALGHKVNLTV